MLSTVIESEVSKEFRRTSVKNTNSLSEDLDWIDLRQQDFNKSIGRIGCPQDWLHLSYNPVTQRLHYEKLIAAEDKEGLEKYRSEVRTNIVTNLMERYRVSESAGTFTIKDGELYSGYFPSEPFSNVLLRGALYRQRQGSTETEREGWLGELAGWKKINNLLADKNTGIGTKVVSLSPPGLTTDTVYTARFVDIFEPKIEKGERIITRKRIAVGWEPQQYEKEVLKFDPGYFKDKDQRSLDSWYLSHPLIVDKDYSPDKAIGTMPKEKFEVIENECSELTEAFLDLIFSREINWRQVAKAFNAIVYKADLVALTLGDYIDRSKIEKTYAASLDSITRLPIWQQINMLGMNSIVELDGFGCPKNRGFSILSDQGNQPFGLNSPFMPTFPMLSNSVAKFSGEGEWKYHSCVNCQKTKGDKTVKWVGPCNICQDCVDKIG